MKTFVVQLDCGCCFSDVQFESRENAEKALEEAGLGNGRTIVDDTGQTFHGIDTFYGIIEKDEVGKLESPILRLFKNLVEE